MAGSSIGHRDAEALKAALRGREIIGGEHEHVSGSLGVARAPERSLQHENRVACAQPHGADLAVVLDSPNFRPHQRPARRTRGSEAIAHPNGDVVDSGHGEEANSRRAMRKPSRGRVGSARISSMSETAPARPANRLVHSTSPYLLQHAHNPVDWYPWGEEALARARDEDVPSSCPSAIRPATGAT